MDATLLSGEKLLNLRGAVSSSGKKQCGPLQKASALACMWIQSPRSSRDCRCLGLPKENLAMCKVCTHQCQSVLEEALSWEVWAKLMSGTSWSTSILALGSRRRRKSSPGFFSPVCHCTRNQHLYAYLLETSWRSSTHGMGTCGCYITASSLWTFMCADLLLRS